jgi:small-conductance mechanosensitive channel
MPEDLSFQSLTDPVFLFRAGTTLAIILLVVLAIAWSAQLRKRLIQKAKQEEPPADAPKKKAGRIAETLIAISLIVLGGWLLLRIWDFDLLQSLRDRGVPVRSLIRSLVIVTIAVALVELSSFTTRRLLARIGQGSGNRRRRAKIRTITPLISGLANAVIVLVAAAMLLSEAGVEIAPLIAGAGVAGIAIGFGAQSLVKDLFTGAFLIIEDIVSHGDVVEIGGVSGVVEAMTLRTIRVRSFDGTLHIFPYGEALVIHNKSSTFSCFAFEIQISYLSDIDTAMEVLRTVGEEIRKDEKLARSILGQLELAGVDRFTDNGVSIKGRIRTYAGENAPVGSAFLRLAKIRLDEAGILIAHRHQPVPPFDMIKDQVALHSSKAQADGNAHDRRDH